MVSLSIAFEAPLCAFTGRLRAAERCEARTQPAACDYIYMKEQSEIVSIIDELIETLRDGEEGFRQAADGVKDPQLKSIFNEYSRQRSRFVTDLQDQVQSLGETEPETSSSVAGALHRGWINLKSALTRGDDHAILAECERGEDSAVEQYQKAMNDDLAAPVREVVSRQYTEIKKAHDHIKSLRDAAKQS